MTSDAYNFNDFPENQLTSFVQFKHYCLWSRVWGLSPPAPETTPVPTFIQKLGTPRWHDAHTTTLILRRHDESFHNCRIFGGVGVVSTWCQCGVDVVSTWCQCGVGVVSTWCRRGVGVVSAWCRCGVRGVGVVSVWCRRGVGVVSVWCRRGVGVVSVWCRRGVGVVSVRCRCGVGVVSTLCGFTVKTFVVSTSCRRGVLRFGRRLALFLRFCKVNFTLILMFWFTLL